MRKLSALLVIVAAGSFLVLPAAGLAAAKAPTPTVVRIAALASGLKYNTKVLHARAGKVELIFTNHSTLHHNVRIEIGEKEFGGTKTIGKGTTTVLLTLKKGTYNFYCSVPGHEDAGMHGSLIVS